jgi:hypothetical protein
MLDNLFRAQIPDAQMRAAAVQAYIQAAGLPPSLATSVNFLSNRYSLNKQLNAGVAWQLARTTTTFSVFKTKRQMLSSQQVDSVLLGSSLATLNDNTEPGGADHRHPARQCLEHQIVERFAQHQPPRRALQPGAHLQHAHYRHRGVAPRARLHRAGRPEVHGKCPVRDTDNEILSIKVFPCMKAITG